MTEKHTNRDYWTGTAEVERQMTGKEVLDFEQMAFNRRKLMYGLSDEDANRGLKNRFSSGKEGKTK